MIDSSMGYGAAHSISAYTQRASYRRNTAQMPSASEDRVSISAEARVLLEESKNTPAPADTKNPFTAEASEKSLSQQLRAYIDNPILTQALDKMKNAVDNLGVESYAAEEIYDLVEQAFRSGIPESGKPTSSALGNLEKELKKTGLLSNKQCTDLMKDIADAVHWAQTENNEDAERTATAGNDDKNPAHKRLP